VIARVSVLWDWCVFAMTSLTALTVAHSLTASITSSSSMSSRSLESSVARAVSDNSWKLLDLNTFYNRYSRSQSYSHAENGCIWLKMSIIGALLS